MNLLVTCLLAISFTDDNTMVLYNRLVVILVIIIGFGDKYWFSFTTVLFFTIATFILMGSLVIKELFISCMTEIYKILSLCTFTNININSLEISSPYSFRLLVMSQTKRQWDFPNIKYCIFFY